MDVLIRLTFILLVFASVERRQNGPIDPSTTIDCTFFIDWPDPFTPELGDTCVSIADYWGISERAFIIWNPIVGSDCSGLIEGNSYCVEENGSTADPPDPPRTTSSFLTSLTSSASSTISSPSTTAASGPSPTQSGIASDCGRFHFVESGDTCTGIVDRYGTFTLSQFYTWNPAVGTSCQGLQAGFHVCIGVSGTPTTRQTSMTSTLAPSTTPDGPQPQQPDVRKDCQRFHAVASGDTCDGIVDMYRTFTTQQFLSWNPDVGSGCEGLWVGYYVCIGVPGTPTTASSTSRTTTSATGFVTPSPIQSGSISTCNRFAKTGSSGATCNGFARNRQISLAQLYAWNRGLGVQGENCASRFANDMNYCMGVSGPLPPPNNGPVQAGVTDICWRYGQAQQGGTCPAFAQRFGIALAQLYAWNPVLGANGENCQRRFWAGNYYCVQVAG